MVTELFQDPMVIWHIGKFCLFNVRELDMNCSVQHFSIMYDKPNVKGALAKYNVIIQLFPKKVGIFVPLEVLAWVPVMIAYRVLSSRMTYF